MVDVIHTHAADAPHGRVRRKEALEFRITLLVTFVILLIGVTVTRLMPSFGRRQADQGERLSVFREAWQKANAAIGFAFLSW
ncbi:hypothetical protein CCR85_12950 [Rhodothalassium salexigens]|uniref:Uncharacterized protein n=1 Tax=Rhodothalassium salexigens DSM 2132 TaxID=1188247 RepID=A0A4R2PIG4_RHOSA|nr:hypothetical protein [Rhodothalassium salexigens]MBB4211342.1 hypothetical protein [Rhodothalassium salexigens DSM 2132]MBK1639492.1 hypothetical protein [Rhodothalassium salexigens DSM 2132]MBK5912393.1 hypothetical protein [Rhodothalassium salexigens]MBK5919997.1 hypothetical protein [Rhodothalassium salexigens]TCP35263.1 hypothetical protein EV659_104113 [Rhodothalassium salexigens DSM 2132]